MNRALVGGIALFLVITASSVFADPLDKLKDGFGGIDWGISISKAEEELESGSFTVDKGWISLEASKEPEMACPTHAGVRDKCIKLFFVEDKLGQIIIGKRRGKDYSLAGGLEFFELMKSKYGTPYTEKSLTKVNNAWLLDNEILVQVGEIGDEKEPYYIELYNLEVLGDKAAPEIMAIADACRKNKK